MNAGGMLNGTQLGLRKLALRELPWHVAFVPQELFIVF